MTLRRLILFGLLSAFLLMGVGAWILWTRPPPTAITLENASNVRPGMTLNEVELILGGPQRNDSTGPTCICYYEIGENDEPQRTPEWYSCGPTPRAFDCHAWWAAHFWQSDCAWIRIGLTGDGRVEWIIANPCQRVRVSPLAMLRHWLRL